jgi:4,5-dihydroxyphthalate decarboxylase
MHEGTGRMENLPLTLTAADYARLMPLATGMVKPDGIDLSLLLGRSGSWPERASMLRRALNDPVVHGGEASMAGHLRRVEAGDKSHVALPVFPLRNFTARDLYVREGGNVKTAADLIGKRVGMYDWVASGSIWYRHFLNFIGVDPASVEWWIGEVDEPRITSHVYSLPDGVHGLPPGQALSEMLIAGELDALLSPPKPRKYHPVNGPIVRLFPDFRVVERDYFRQTDMFPPQHLIVLRRAVWEANKLIAGALTDAFIRGNDMFDAAQRGFPYVSPWLEAELEETEAVMGLDFHPYGFEKNRRTIEVFANQAFDVGIVGRHISPEEYFADFLQS